jgi:hypothetical protein
VQKGNFSVVKASSSTYQGDLVLTGNNVTTIEGEFDINGSIMVEENATLILRNTVVNLTQSAIYTQNVTLTSPMNGNPRLQLENATITSNLVNRFEVNLLQNSTATLTDSSITGYLNPSDSANVSVSTSTMGYFYPRGNSVGSVNNSTIDAFWATGSPNVTIFDSAINFLWYTCRNVNSSIANIMAGPFSSWDSWINSSLAFAPIVGSAPKLTFQNSNIQGWKFEFDGSSNATITDSNLSGLELLDNSVVYTVNTNVTGPITVYGGSVVYASWYLNVHVLDSMRQDIPLVNVTCSYPNAAATEWALTDQNGRANFTLAGATMDASGSYPVGNYNVTAVYLYRSNSTTVNMTGDNDVILALDLVIPEFPSSFFLTLFMTLTLVGVVTFYKRKSMRSARSAKVSDVNKPVW